MRHRFNLLNGFALNGHVYITHVFATLSFNLSFYDLEFLVVSESFVDFQDVFLIESLCVLGHLQSKIGYNFASILCRKMTISVYSTSMTLSSWKSSPSMNQFYGGNTITFYQILFFFHMFLCYSMSDNLSLKSSIKQIGYISVPNLCRKMTILNLNLCDKFSSWKSSIPWS